MTIAAGAAAQEVRYNVGRVASEEEVRHWEVPVGPAGANLPAGEGTAAEGEAIYRRSCAACHGEGGEDGRYSELKGHLRLYATTTFDFIYRSMPRRLDNPGIRDRQLSADEVYALTAYILHINGLLEKEAVMNAESLPKVKIPFDPDQ